MLGGEAQRRPAVPDRRPPAAEQAAPSSFAAGAVPRRSKSPRFSASLSPVYWPSVGTMPADSSKAEDRISGPPTPPGDSKIGSPPSRLPLEFRRKTSIVQPGEWSVNRSGNCDRMPASERHNPDPRPTRMTCHGQPDHRAPDPPGQGVHRRGMEAPPAGTGGAQPLRPLHHWIGPRLSSRKPGPGRGRRQRCPGHLGKPLEVVLGSPGRSGGYLGPARSQAPVRAGPPDGDREREAPGTSPAPTWWRPSTCCSSARAGAASPSASG